MKITEEQYHNHDCHLSPHDSCKTCELWFSQKENRNETNATLTPLSKNMTYDSYHQYLDEQCLDEKQAPEERLTKCYACGEDVKPEQVIEYQGERLCPNCYNKERGYVPTDQECLDWLGK